MASESARASSAAEAHFRIDDANSRQRTVKVVALDAGSEAVVMRLAAAQWGGTAFTAAFAAGMPVATNSEPGDGDGADLVALVATAGEELAAARAIGEACRGATTIAFVLTDASTAQEALSHTLARLRPWTLMLTVVADEDCVAEVLRALRA